MLLILIFSIFKIYTQYDHQQSVYNYLYHHENSVYIYVNMPYDPNNTLICNFLLIISNIMSGNNSGLKDYDGFDGQVSASLCR